MKPQVGAVLLLALVFPLRALASTYGAPLSVTASVTSNCIVSAPSAIDFGTYNPTAQGPGSPLDFSGSAVTLECTKGAPGVTIALDEGTFANGTNRNMQSQSGNGTIHYEVYTDQGYSTVWNNNNKVTYLPPNDQPTTIQLYGQIPGGQTPSPGRYTDTLMAVVSF